MISLMFDKVLLNFINIEILGLFSIFGFVANKAILVVFSIRLNCLVKKLFFNRT